MGTAAFHRGLDIAAPTGSTIVAARSGTVTFAGWSDRGYGNLVKVRHAGGAETWYAHASRILVRVGQSVSQGDPIALVGSTGLSTGPHLHLELHVGGIAIDPLGELR
jgi:murein DD-endopeptidase MepM/ murein hydrolase activator NlpD